MPISGASWLLNHGKFGMSRSGTPRPVIALHAPRPESGLSADGALVGVLAHPCQGPGPQISAERDPVRRDPPWSQLRSTRVSRCTAQAAHRL